MKIIVLFNFNNLINKTMKISKQDAHDLLYEMWQNGEVPSYFTESHSEYDEAVKFTINYGYFDYDDCF